MSLSVVAFFFLIVVIYQNKNANHNNTATVLSYGIITFFIIFGLNGKYKKIETPLKEHLKNIQAELSETI